MIKFQKLIFKGKMVFAKLKNSKIPKKFWLGKKINFAKKFFKLAKKVRPLLKLYFSGYKRKLNFIDIVTK
jgi:hypothetical protein